MRRETLGFFQNPSFWKKFLEFDFPESGKVYGIFFEIRKCFSRILNFRKFEFLEFFFQNLSLWNFPNVTCVEYFQKVRPYTPVRTYSDAMHMLHASSRCDAHAQCKFTFAISNFQKLFEKVTPSKNPNTTKYFSRK